MTHVLFGGLRRCYEGAGLRAGVRARCRARTPDAVHLELEDGRTAKVGKVHARFVEVRFLPAAEPAVCAPLLDPALRDAPQLHATPA